MTYYVFIKMDSKNRITAVDSSGFLADASSWTQIDEGSGDKYYLAQGNYFEKSIMDERGIYRYALDENNKPYERTQEEMDADYIAPIPIPSQLDIIEAQVTYTAIMTDTLLEG